MKKTLSKTDLEEMGIYHHSGTAYDVVGIGEFNSTFSISLWKDPHISHVISRIYDAAFEQGEERGKKLKAAEIRDVLYINQKDDE